MSQAESVSASKWFIPREAILGYVFWNINHAIGPMIWFYPLNDLEISGYEAFVITMLSPVLMSFGPLDRFVRNRWTMAVLRLLTVGCLASFQAPTTLLRLITLSAGCFFLMLVFVSSITSKNSRQRALTFWGMILGYFLFLSSRIWFVSFVPTWWSNQCNSVVIAIAIIATVDKIISGDDGLPADDERTSNNSAEEKSPNWLLVALGYGSLHFLLHWIYGEVSIPSRWVVRGYPDHGPHPYPWGAVILIALAIGVVLGSRSRAATSMLWWLIGVASLAALYYLPSTKGFVGGVVLAVYTMSLWPEMIDRVTRCPPVRTIVLGMLFHIVLILYEVWTVAFNFVPGGVYTREHTDHLAAIVMVTIGLSMFIKAPKKSKTSFVQVDGSRMPTKLVYIVLFWLVTAGLLGFESRYNPDRISHPDKVHPKKDISAAIWTYHFGYDNQGWPSLERSAKMLNETGADFITLLESDASKPFLGNNDLGMWLGEKLGMHVDFGPSTKDHTWGNLILSKYPIVKSTHHLLPSPKGELAPAITATVNYTGDLVDFVVTHMGNDRDVLDRELQAKVLSSELRNSPNPVIFLGYVTSAPYSRDYKQLTGQGRVKDIDDTDRDRWCEYIMYRGLTRLGYARISHSGLSDTEVQMARFRIPEKNKPFKDHDRIVIDPKKVDPDVHFNSRFGPYRSGHNYIWEHLFHMDTPKYFVP